MRREIAAARCEIDYVERQLERLERGELEPELFKKVRLQYGVYSMRRSPTRYMVRVRIPLGVIRPRQLAALAEICAAFTPSRSCHLTTRQDVQLYGVDRSCLPMLLSRLDAAGLTTREASGNVVRNVTCCPWAGVAPDEPFDVTPYARAASDYLLRNPLTQLLPRKVKIAFEGCPADHVRTVIHDIGVMAALRDGQRGFRIYAGGGLGPSPRAAQLLEPWTSEELLLPSIEAILRIFDRFGERRMRARARLKFLVEQLGWDVFRERTLEERRLVWATQSGYALQMPSPEREEPPARTGRAAARVTDSERFARWRATNAAAQKQAGFVTATVRVPCGDLTETQLRGLAALARRAAGGVRCTTTQNLLLRCLPVARLPDVHQALGRIGLSQPGSDRLADVTRCPGADSCLSAITRPRGLAEAIDRLCRNGLSALADEPLTIKISGCPNSCGHHHVADIGGFGVAVKAGERHVPCYQLLIGGRTGEGMARFGERLARVPARRAPEAIARLLRAYGAGRQLRESFAAFVERVGLDSLQQSLRDLTDLTDAACHPELFTDLGDTEPFALEAGKGECAE